MNKKLILPTFALAGLMGASLLAGAVFSSNNKVVAQADSGDTWMFAAVFDASTIPNSYRDQCHDFQFHVWGTNVDETFNMHSLGVEDVYTVNCSFNNDQAVTGGQFIFYQGSAKKESVDASFGYNKDSDFMGTMKWKFKEENGWPNGKFELAGQAWSRIQYTYKGNQADFTADPVNNRFIFSDVLVEESDVWSSVINICFGGTWNYTFDMIGSKEYVASGSNNWFYFNAAGTYDIIIANQYSEGGVVQLKKHGSPEASYVYYVTGSNDPTTHYIYSFGNGTDKQFGNWPGTLITAITDVEEVTDNGVMHFQGGDPKLIYKIPVNVGGYPNGDDHIIVHDGNGSQTANMLLVPGSAYWWSTDVDYHNDDAGLALDFLVAAEAKRDAATYKGLNFSICGISQADATALYNAYMALDPMIRSTYVNGTTVYTYTKKDGSESGMVRYDAIMNQLAFNYNLGNQSAPLLTLFNEENKSFYIVLASLMVIVSISGIIFFSFKRKGLSK